MLKLQQKLMKIIATIGVKNKYNNNVVEFNRNSDIKFEFYFEDFINRINNELCSSRDYLLE